MASAYRLNVPAVHQRLFNSFPERIRNELRLRMENLTALAVSGGEDPLEETSIHVEGYSVRLRLDTRMREVVVISMSSP